VIGGRRNRAYLRTPALGAVLLLAAGLGAHGRDAIIDEAEFVARAQGALERPDVRREVALRLGERLVAEHPELRGAERAVAAAVADAVRDPRFDAAFRAGVADMHAALFDGGRPVSLELPGTMAMVRAAADRAPATRGLLERELAAADAPPLITLGSGGVLERELRRAAPAAGGIATLWPAALVLGLGLLAFAVVREPGRRSLRAAALAAAAAGAVAALATVASEVVLLTTFTSRHGDAVVDAIWDSYLADVRTGGLVALAAGLAVAAAGSVALKSR
jgi:hypothetical protein